MESAAERVCQAGLNVSMSVDSQQNIHVSTVKKGLNENRMIVKLAASLAIYERMFDV